MMEVYLNAVGLVLLGMATGGLAGIILLTILYAWLSRSKKRTKP